MDVIDFCHLKNCSHGRWTFQRYCVFARFMKLKKLFAGSRGPIILQTILHFKSCRIVLLFRRPGRCDVRYRLLVDYNLKSAVDGDKTSDRRRQRVTREVSTAAAASGLVLHVHFCQHLQSSTRIIVVALPALSMSLATGLSFAALQPPLHAHTLLSLEVRRSVEFFLLRDARIDGTFCRGWDSREQRRFSKRRCHCCCSIRCAV
jgi:hypothetical protein